MNTCSDIISAQSHENRSSRADVAALALVRTVRVFAQMGHAFVRTVRVFADACCPLRARSLLAPASTERFPDRRGHLMRNLVDLVPGEVHDLEAGPAQRGVAPELGNRSVRVRVLDRPIGLANS